MGYYGGATYYRGDYYRRGDPGILSTIGGAIGGLFGGPAGAAVGAGLVNVGQSLLQPKPKPQGGGGISFGLPGLPKITIGQSFGPMAGGRKRRPRKGEPGYRHPRMHVTNPKALRRAIRRAQGFEKLAMKVLGFTRPHRPKGRPYFKRKRAAR